MNIPILLVVEEGFAHYPFELHPHERCQADYLLVETWDVGGYTLYTDLFKRKPEELGARLHEGRGGSCG